MKKYFFLLLLSFAAFAVNAQISTAWKTTIPAASLPSGATLPSPAAIDATSLSKANFEIDLDAVTYDNATETTAFTAIGDATKTEIDSNYIEDVFGIDPALNIVGRVVITQIQRRFDNFEPNDLPMQYTAATDIFRVTGYFEWGIEAP